MILVDVVFLHSAVTSGCRLSSEMSMTETTPENTESFSTRAFQATASIPNAEFTNFASKITQSGDITIVHPEPVSVVCGKYCIAFLFQYMYSRIHFKFDS